MRRKEDGTLFDCGGHQCQNTTCQKHGSISKTCLVKRFVWTLRHDTLSVCSITGSVTALTSTHYTTNRLHRCCNTNACHVFTPVVTPQLPVRSCRGPGCGTAGRWVPRFCSAGAEPSAAPETWKQHWRDRKHSECRQGDAGWKRPAPVKYLLSQFVLFSISKVCLNMKRMSCRRDDWQKSHKNIFISLKHKQTWETIWRNYLLTASR